MPSNFFTELGKSVAAELGRPSGQYPANPSVRQELANIMGDDSGRPPQPPTDDRKGPSDATTQSTPRIRPAV